MPMVEGQAFASSQYNGSGVLVRGVRGEDMAQIEAIAGNMRQGTLDNFDEAGGVAIGRRLAESLSLQAGDTMTLITPRGAPTPFGTAPRIKGYPVVGGLRDRHVGVRRHLRLHAASRRRRPTSTATAT